MADGDNKQVVRRYYEEVLNEGKIEVLDEVAVEDYAEHDPLPGQATGRQGLKERVSMLRALSPRFTIEDLIAEDEKVVVRWSQQGRHSGDFLGIPPTNKDINIAGIDIHAMRDGRMAEHWHVVDQLALMQQLGLVPVPGGPA